jgi:pimeloyl-ACP methyl ester carboxylesterase
MSAIAFRTRDVEGTRIFYREAGPADGPGVLLLHGFPTSSHMFRNLIPHLSDRFHVVAPDLPGFGFTAPTAGYRYSFASLAETVGRFTEAVGLTRYAMYVFDYGAPVGYRLAVAHPERVTALISQNGNAYVEGLSQGWGPVRAYWRDPSLANREALRDVISPKAVEEIHYRHGVSDPLAIAPEAYTLDSALLARPGNAEIQMGLLADYATNIDLYPTFQAYFRDRQPPLLATWGRNDPFFLPAGAEAYRRDVPSVDVRFYDTGHFALETHANEIGTAVREFLGRHL